MSHPAFHPWLHGQIAAWEAEGLVPAELARRLRERYPLAPSADASPGHRLTAVFGILGAILVIGGIILLFAYNWNGLGRGLRTALAVAPLLATQLAAGWALARRPGSLAWREGSAAGVVLSIGAAIALVAQTYQLGGDFGRFMQIWVLLALPVVYLLRSGAAWTLVVAGTAVLAGYQQGVVGHGYGALVLAGATVPFLVWVARRRADPRRRVLLFFAGLGLGPLLALAHDYRLAGSWLFLCGGLAASALLLVPPGHRTPGAGGGAFRIPAVLAIAGLLTVFSYGDVWRSFARAEGGPLAPIGTLGLAATGLVLAAALALGVRETWRTRRRSDLAMAASVLLWSAAGWAFGRHPETAPVLMLATNGLLLALGVGWLLAALREGRHGAFNASLLLLGGLILLRFFDSDLGLVPRGLVFIAVGVGFLAANLFFTRHQRRHRVATPADHE